jgi:FkbM family methyltransferase
MTVLDLGAYSGLTSILFCQAVGTSGTVVAVEADRRNIACLRRNVANFRKYGRGTLLVCEGAVWSSNDGLEFSSEGNMGSSAASILGRNRGSAHMVPSFTLSALCARFDLSRVDFIKCDIEGAEQVIFGDEAFFERCRPRIMIEPHVVGGVETTAACASQLQRFGYTCTRIEQEGVSLPLLQCVPVR